MSGPPLYMDSQQHLLSGSAGVLMEAARARITALLAQSLTLTDHVTAVSFIWLVPFISLWFKHCFFHSKIAPSHVTP